MYCCCCSPLVLDSSRSYEEIYGNYTLFNESTTWSEAIREKTIPEYRATPENWFQNSASAEAKGNRCSDVNCSPGAPRNGPKDALSLTSNDSICCVIPQQCFWVGSTERSGQRSSIPSWVGISLKSNRLISDRFSSDKNWESDFFHPKVNDLHLRVGLDQSC